MPRKLTTAEGGGTQRRSGRASTDGPRSLDQRQRERARLARIASLERDNHQQDNTHMMKEQVYHLKKIVPNYRMLIKYWWFAAIR